MFGIKREEFLSFSIVTVYIYIVGPFFTVNEYS